MAAPSGITWGNEVNDEGRIGIYTSVSSTNTQTTVSVQVWFWSKYAIVDSNNTFYYDILSSSGSATTSKGSVSVKTTVSSGNGWSTTNQIKIASYTHTYSRGTSAAKKYIYAKLTNVDLVGAQMLASKTVSIPALPTYTISYNANGGSGAPSSQTKTYGKTLTLSSTKPTRTGYSFKNWNTASGGTGTSYASGASYTANASATLYAQWTANKYTISYNANGGSGAPSSQTKTHGVALTLSSEKPTRTGYSFQGWSKTASGGVAYSSGSSYTANANATLYAVWKANTYAVTYNANGGSGAPSTQTKTHNVTLKLSTTIPTKAGFTFKGWGTSSSATTVSYAAGANYTNNSAITLYAIWVSAYSKPTITSYTVSRCNGSGVASSSGTYAKVTFNWKVFNVTPTVKIDWKAASETTWSEPTPVTIVGTSGSVKDFVIGGSLSTNSSYSIRVTVDDETESVTAIKIIGGASKAISVLAKGKGIAFGKSAELTGYMDVAFKSRFRDSVAIDNQKYIYGINSAGEEVQILAPMNGNDNTVIGWGNYSGKSSNTNIYGHDIMLGISNINKPGSDGYGTGFRPYFRQGDSFSVGYRGAGYVTGAGAQVVFIVPLAKQIIGSPTVTVTSGNGFTLRQNNLYTHGSSSSVYCFPDSYETSVIDGVGVYINAKFSTTTNVINNAPIGIYWGGTITFS